MTRINDSIHINKTKVIVSTDEEVNILDSIGQTAQYQPIAIIHHIGDAIGDTTRGHFLADVKNKDTHKWFRTSDSDPPQDLTQSGLTKNGYIFLYKKKHN